MNKRTNDYVITRYSKKLKVGICGSILKPVYYDGDDVQEMIVESHQGALKYRFRNQANRISYKAFANNSIKTNLKINVCPF